ncbi:MAG: DUF2933 domain-containing protein [Methanotrichaceae archaeon]|nr:DUF2933 domain-containing protein [Methanotrichaceae archaeon]MDD1758023.1 DUF2933 domain-containing protein [Methanotrichaceae archaeon]
MMDFKQKAVVLFILVTIAFYLFTKHEAHLLAYSSYIIFFVYLLMHLFMHRRHGGHGKKNHAHEEIDQKEVGMQHQ